MRFRGELKEIGTVNLTRLDFDGRFACRVIVQPISPAQAQSKRRESAKNNLFSNFKS